MVTQEGIAAPTTSFTRLHRSGYGAKSCKIQRAEGGQNKAPWQKVSLSSRGKRQAAALRKLNKCHTTHHRASHICRILNIVTPRVQKIVFVF